MTPNRKLLGAAAFSLALAGGGVAGALLGTPSLSNAQDGADQSDSVPTDDGPGGHFRHRGEGLATAAEALGISEDDRRSALAGGKSIAEVAEANDVDEQTVIDALVADATTRIEEAVANGRIDADRAEEIEANLLERITARVNGEDPEPHDDAAPYDEAAD